MFTKLLHQFSVYLLTQRRFSLHTQKAYCSDIKEWLFFLDGAIHFEQARSNHFSSFLQYLYNKQKGARTVARKIASLKAFYSYLQETNHCINNDVWSLVAPTPIKSLPQFLTEQDIARLLDVYKDSCDLREQRNSMILHLLYALGLRVSELVRLKIQDINFHDATILISGKGNKERILPLPENTLIFLKKYVHKLYPLLLKEHVIPITFPLFGIKQKSIISHFSRQALWKIVKKVCFDAGLPQHISPHQLRHSLATHLLKNGAHLRAIQLLLGHKSIATVEIYTHVEQSRTRLIYDKKHLRS